RRGGDPALEARLREEERLAAGGAADEAPADWTPEAAAPVTDTDDLPLLEWSVAEPERAAADEPAAFAGGESLPYASPAPEGEDAFAGSFEDGFGDVTLAPAAGLHDAFDGYAPEPDEVAALEDRSLPWSAPESEAEEVAAIFARDEAFLAPAPADLPPLDAPDSADADEPLVVGSAAHEILSGEPFSDESADDDFGAPEPFAATPSADDFAAEPSIGGGLAFEEPWTGGAPATDGEFAAEPQAGVGTGFELDADFADTSPYAEESTADGGVLEPVAAFQEPGAGFEEPREPVAAEAEQPAAAPAVEFRSAREYLSGLASWQPAGAAGPVSAEAPAAPAAEEPAAALEAIGDGGFLDVAPSTMEEAPAAAEHTPAADFHDAAVEDEEDDMPWLAAPVSGDAAPAADDEPMEIDGLLAAESAGAAASASAGDDDELYPWEVAPAAPQAADEPAAPAEAQPQDAGVTTGFSFEEFFVEPASAPEPPAVAAPEARAPEPTAATAPPAAQPPAAAADAGGEDEDLESFQAWLQSLKR
ncbi:MAG TPA: hypothetical protein VF615_04460, partial [Longimicrobiaceae bacterium]